MKSPSIILIALLGGVIGSVSLFSGAYAQNMSMSENTTMSKDMSMNSNQNMSATNTGEMGIDTKNASISKVVTRDYGTEVVSLIFVKYQGDLLFNHVAILQTNLDTKIIKSSISSKWEPEITGNNIAFHSDKIHVSKGKTLVIKVITDSKPDFKLSLVATH